MFHLTLLGWINTYNTLVIPALDNQHELVNLSFYKSLRTLPESAYIFAKCFPKTWSRRGSKYTLRNWLHSVANRKTRISIRHVGINVQVQSSLDRSAVPFSPWQSTTKVALVKATKHKANPATDEVRVENRNHGLAWSKSGNNKTVTLHSYIFRSVHHYPW